MNPDWDAITRGVKADELEVGKDALTPEEIAKVAVDPKWTAVAMALADLYQEYYEMGNEQNRVDVEVALGRLMGAYNTWLG